MGLPHLLAELSQRWKIGRLLVEGGGTVHQSMIAKNLYDEIRLIICPFVIGGSRSITPVGRRAFWPKGITPRYRLEKAEVMGDYLYVVYKPKDVLNKT